ncbi:hypothetical protein ADK90_19350 [Streptomyces sp. XY413]|nr:hypothetical protein ADK90_19350 [Streptomyces sp. XY413]
MEAAVDVESSILGGLEQVAGWVAEFPYVVPVAVGAEEHFGGDVFGAGAVDCWELSAKMMGDLGVQILVEGQEACL